MARPKKSEAPDLPGVGVDGRGVADDAPSRDFEGMPRLTVRMCALVQGFPDDWQFAGKKTPSYRQVGNAFPPPVAHAVSAQIASAIEQAASQRCMKLAA